LLTAFACSPEMNFNPERYQTGKKRVFSNTFTEVYNASLLAMSSNGLNVAERKAAGNALYIISSGKNIAVMLTIEPFGNKIRIWINERKSFKLNKGKSHKMTDILLDLITIRLRS